MLLTAVAYAPAVTTTINPTQFISTATAIGDINGDGRPDLIVGHDNGTGQTFLGTSTGTFNLGNLVGPGAQVLTLADFTGDGNLDLATAVGVLPGTGAGAFGIAKPGFTLPFNTVAFYAADINGDGKEDLIAATFVQAASSGQSATLGISVFLGKGDGTFAAPIATTLGSAVGISKAFANLSFDDFNNDGHIDVLSPFGVRLGKGDGTFQTTTLPLAVASSGSSGGTSGSGSGSTPAAPVAPIFTIGDFNSDGNLDVAILPPTSSSATTPGSVELLLGKGDGTFSSAKTVSIGTGVTITALASADLNADGNADLIAGTISGASSSLNVLLGNGDGTFAAPSAFAVAGTPLTIDTGDFNGDGVPDLISIDAPAGSVPGTTVLPPVTASVLLSSPPATQTPTVTLLASAPRVIAGATVQYALFITPPPPAPVTPGTLPKLVNSPTPTGTVTFTDGTKLIGFANVVNGLATITSTATGVGIQSITAAYSGDANYAAVTSRSLSETVLLSAANAPLLVPSLISITAPSLFLPKDTATISIELINGGGGTASGRIAINLYLSTNGVIDSNSIPLNAPSFRNRPILIASGRSTTITASVVFGAYPPASYKIIAQIVPLTVLTAAEFTQDTLVSPTSFQAAGLVFGTVGTHHGLTLTITDAAGDQATLAIIGSGTGTVTQTLGVNDLTVTSTTSTSTLQITKRTGTFQFDAINIAGPIGTINGRTASVDGNLTVTGSVSSLFLAAAGSGNAPASINLGAGTSTTLSLGNVQGVTLTSAAPIRSLAATAWAGGAIIAPSITTLSVRGQFDADVQTHNTTALQSAILGSITGGTWAIAGNIGVLHVIGDLSTARIFAGANAGPDDIFATADDTYAAAIIGSVLIGGADTSSTIAAGATPPPGETINAGFTLLPKSAIRSIIVRGTVSSDSLFAAAALPARANLTGVLVATVSNPNFQR
jgi:hypothetical protein